MLTKIVNGEEVECSSEEAAEIQAEWDANAAEKAQEEINTAKEERRAELRAEKLDAMLTTEFAEIDAATTKSDIKKIKLRG